MAFIGHPFPAFSVRITDERDRPVPGVAVRVDIVSATDHRMEVPINGQYYPVRDYNCYRFLTDPPTEHTHEDAVLCRTRLRHHKSATDARGAAAFAGLTVVTAAPGAYLAYFTAEGAAVIGRPTLHSTFTLSSTVVEGFFEAPSPPEAYGDGFVVNGTGAGVRVPPCGRACPTPCGPWGVVCGGRTGCRQRGWVVCTKSPPPPLHTPQRGSGLGEGRMRGRGALSPPTGGSSAGTPPSLFSMRPVDPCRSSSLIWHHPPPPSHTHTHTRGSGLGEGRMQGGAFFFLSP